MAATGLLALIDDIATLLDDVAALSKVAAGKTAGVLGDDLALNAEQVSGVRAQRELPVVFAVAKGSLLNKLVLVPSALAINAWLPALVIVLLMLGGAYLCYEGFEKLVHRFLQYRHGDNGHKRRLAAVADSTVDMREFERQRIKGAIRTDFILSAEIIVITLGVVRDAPFASQLMVLAGLALVITLGVYGLVAAIVKLDDAGLYLSKAPSKLQRRLGRAVLAFAPWLMKALSVAGTAAMFLVGGGILLHQLPGSHALLHGVAQATAALPWPGLFASLAEMALAAFTGLASGGLLLALVLLWQRLAGRQA